ncbi:MAG: hypothetical protein Q9165_008635 [Trypethelium subeluteriae]
MPIYNPTSTDPVIQDFLLFTSPNQSKEDAWFSDQQIEEKISAHVDDLGFFLPEQKLYAYFDEKLHDIIDALHQENEHDSFEASSIRKGYLKIFAILLRIERSQAISYFLRYETLADIKLPFQDKPDGFPEETGHDTTFWAEFNESQWIFCAPKLVYKPEAKWHPRQPLPIISRERLDRGSTAETFKIRVHPDYNYLRSNELAVAKDVFVLKTYHNKRNARLNWTEESKTFVRIRESIDGHKEEALVQFFGSLEQGDAYHIILEYANKGTLEQYWQNVAQPREPKDIGSSWENILSLVRAMQGIHNIVCRPEASHNEGRGWHQDIKPANVLCNLSGNRPVYQCVYKLADLGLSHVVLGQSRDARVIDSRGTRTYGAPETYRPDEVTETRERYVTQKIDVWSLGCILVEHAVWLTQGKKGLEDFRTQRVEATNDLGMGNTDCFHDGSHVLHVVSEKLEELKERTQKGDHFTEKVIRDLIPEMLRHESKRTLSDSLWTKAKLVLNRSRRDSEEYNSSTQSDHERVVTPSTIGSNTGSSSSSSALASPPSPKTTTLSKNDEAAPTTESPESLAGVLNITSRTETNLQTHQSHDEPVRSNTLQGIDTASSRNGSVFPMVLSDTFDIRDVKQAIQSGANVDEKNKYGQTLIMLAAQEGKFDVLEFLQDKVQLDLQDNRNHSLLYYLLSVRGGTSRMDKVLYCARSAGKSLDVDAADSQGWTLLHEAARTEKYEAIQVLLSYGADINVRDQNNQSPAQVALKNNKVDALKCLLKANCELEVQKDDLEGRHPAIKELLKEYNKIPEGTGLRHRLSSTVRRLR